MVKGDNELMAKLLPEEYKARPEQGILFVVDAWDSNFQQHIPQPFEAAESSHYC
jgi:predicted pyridoxine 5'-phosphate oxidase superfamily flavin-nucleotide-binding protein